MELETDLNRGKKLGDSVEASLGGAIAATDLHSDFHSRGLVASQAYHATGVSVPLAVVLVGLQSKLDAKRKRLGQ